MIGRDTEQSVLKKMLHSKTAEFMALYGRRRVGKTYLITHYFSHQPCLFFYASGLQKGSLKVQISEFYKHISATFFNGVGIQPRYRWMDVFEDLTQAMTPLLNHQKIVLFFDELPWMATPKSGLLEALDYYWNRHWSHCPNLKLIVCGSSTSWIIQKIINHKGGLYNRVTQTLQLFPFSLRETELFLKSMDIHFNRFHILDIYLALGGIPHYLRLIEKGLSSHQALERLFFQKDGALLMEFDRLFESLFYQQEPYLSLIKIISQFSYGISLSELQKISGLSSGGRLNLRLKELEDSGFINCFIPYGRKEKGLYYKIQDEFILFYLKWVQPYKNTIKKQKTADEFWLSKINTPAWHAWAGISFEAVCYKHLSEIRKSLHIPNGSEIGSWKYAAKRHEMEDKGIQVDLLFDRPDGVITLCEIKYNRQPMTIEKSYAQTLKDREQIFQKITGTSKDIFTALITAGGVTPNLYSQKYIDQWMTLDHLFDAR